MHAWPELYFAGYGWVRFEPTPASVTGSAPAWTLPGADDPADSADDEPTAAPSASTDPAPRPSPDGGARRPADDPRQHQRIPLGPHRCWAPAIGLVVLLVAGRSGDPPGPPPDGPAGSGDQLADEQVEAAWAEIRDTVLDLGGTWPRVRRARSAAQVGDRLDAEESAAMGQVATLVERSRYARSLDADAATLPALTQEIRRGIVAPLSRRRRLLGLLVPRSLFRRADRDPDA